MNTKEDTDRRTISKDKSHLLEESHNSSLKGKPGQGGYIRQGLNTDDCGYKKVGYNEDDDCVMMGRNNGTRMNIRMNDEPMDHVDSICEFKRRRYTKHNMKEHRTVQSRVWTKLICGF